MRGGGNTFEQFSNSLIHAKYRTLSLSELVQFMTEHTDMYVVTDKLFGDERVVSAIVEQIVGFSGGNNSILDRFIVQVYGEDNFRLIDSIHHFNNYIYTTYTENENRLYRTALFCVKNKIPVITMWHDRARRADISLLVEKGIRVYTHTVNTKSELAEDKSHGVSGVYTDFLLPE